MQNPSDILATAFRRANKSLEQPIIADTQIRKAVQYISTNLRNRAGVRLLMSCLLAKLHKPKVDVRKPYTQIKGPDSFSGRSYDEKYITNFINTHNLPCNNTTAFLTPALRNRNVTLTRDINLVGRPQTLYTAVLDLLDYVHGHRVSADDLLAETIRCLIIERNQRDERMKSLIASLEMSTDDQPLSSENIINLIYQHKSLKGTSRLPVLMVAAAYKAAQQKLGERVLTLASHNAADVQTGTLGDVEVTLIDDARVVTSYEMKDRRVTRDDIKRALQKLDIKQVFVDNYIFITTDTIDEDVQEYARSLYVETGGIEFVILDCMSFLRHYLHFFHRLRSNFLEEYQSLILAEPNSSVSQPLKEAFLSMRQALEAATTRDDLA
ncbi:restriction endonuclease, SacI family [Geitlerinema sp. P-1104]|uniref:restriction endonuclease, SacI family n=1 Tax=Geitlerinema sp. P-1104 TaxID=2546230 RepID=UPI0014770A75|nr:restriction endonuclease, SacI family [Geitlerinema sp. P-1104]NMG60422.1 restriction endonuclease, SacI family [Geitlerinema sp. P-1104]